MTLNTEGLKEKVLDLAFKGKLTFNESFQNSQIYVKEIRNKRQSMIDNKEIRKPRGGVDAVDISEVPFDIPEKWVWDKIGYIFNIFNGDSINRKLKTEKYMNVSKGYNYIGTKDVGYFGEIQTNTGVKIPLNEKSDFTIVSANRPLICCEGGSAGKKVGFTKEELSFGNKLYGVDSFGDFNYKYLFYYYKYSQFYKQFEEKMTGVIGGVSMSKFREIYIPIPPLEEQKRIVQKIEELFEIIDNLNEQGEKQLETLENLREKTLDLAIKGKLVEQDENDEPASELIKRIEEEKRELIKEGKIKKSRSKIKPIKDDEIPFEIPDSWEFVKVGNICQLISGKDEPVSVCNADELGIPYVMGASNIHNNIFIPERWIEEIKTLAIKNDFVITVKGTVGDYFINEFDKINLSRQTKALRPYYSELLDYLVLWYKFYVKELEEKSQGIIPGITNDDIKDSLNPLPPLNEQKRIVEKVDSIMKIIDKMEEELEKKYEIVEKLGSV